MSIEEVRALVAERQRYDDWLAALDARRAETPVRVFERVRGDYADRRSEVLVKLHEHVGALEALGVELSQQVGDLTTRIEALEDRRIEAMLRNAVGEYDNDRWETLRTDVESEMGKLNGDRSVVQQELEEIHALLAEARPATAHTAPPSREHEAASETGVAGPGDAPGAAEPVARPAIDADGESVQGAGTVASLEDVPGAADAEPPVADSQADGVDGGAAQEIEELPELIVEPFPAIDVAASASEGAADLGPLVTQADLPAIADDAFPVHQGTEMPLAGSEVDDALALFAETPAQPMPSVSAPVDPFDDLAFLRSVIEPSGAQQAVPAPATMTPPSQPAAVAPGAAPSSSEPSKTLRCTECGTMNLPTEWYCERCGGELAAF